MAISCSFGIMSAHASLAATCDSCRLRSLMHSHQELKRSGRGKQKRPRCRQPTGQRRQRSASDPGACYRRDAAFWLTVGALPTAMPADSAAIEPRRSDAVLLSHRSQRCLFRRGRYEDAMAWARRAISERPTYLLVHRLHAANLALLGRLDAANDAVQILRRLALARP